MDFKYKFSITEHKEAVDGAFSLVTQACGIVSVIIFLLIVFISPKFSIVSSLYSKFGAFRYLFTSYREWVSKRFEEIGLHDKLKRL
jgi:hypothetical protein